MARRGLAFGTLAVLVLVVLSGCAKQAPPSYHTFAVDVLPAEVHETRPDQLLVFMVRVTGLGGPVRLGADLDGAAVPVQPDRASPGDVAEVTVRTLESHLGRTITLTVTGERDGVTRNATAAFPVVTFPGAGPAEDAARVRDAFLPWLAANRPGYGITADTDWEGDIARVGILVVAYYVFYSERWEVGVRWHVMIPPYDWGEVYLRERFQDTEPTLQLKIDSLSGATDPYEVAPEGIWR